MTGRVRRAALVSAALLLAVPGSGRAATPAWVETHPVEPGTATVIDGTGPTAVAVVAGTQLLVSRDAGLSWAATLPLLGPPTGGSSQTLVAVAGDQDWYALNGSALSATSDGGATWQRRDLPEVAPGSQVDLTFGSAVTALPGSRVVLAAAAGSFVREGCPYPLKTVPVFASASGGTAWRRADLPVQGQVSTGRWLDARRAAVVVTEFDFSPTERDSDGSCGYTGESAGTSLWTTQDGGRSWRRSREGLGQLMTAQWLDARRLVAVDERLGVGTGFASRDAGRTWTSTGPVYDTSAGAGAGLNGFPRLGFATPDRGYLGVVVAGVFRGDAQERSWTHELSPADGAFYGVPDLVALGAEQAVMAGPRSLITRTALPVAAGPVVAAATPPDVLAREWFSSGSGRVERTSHLRGPAVTIAVRTVAAN